MSSPGEVLGDVSATAVDPLHWSPVDGDVGVLTGPSPDIHHQLLGITDVVAPVSQGVHLFSVSQFIITVIRPTTVLSSANLTMTLELCVATQSCVYSEYRRGLRTQP